MTNREIVLKFLQNIGETSQPIIDEVIRLCVSDVEYRKALLDYIASHPGYEVRPGYEVKMPDSCATCDRAKATNNDALIECTAGVIAPGLSGFIWKYDLRDCELHT